MSDAESRAERVTLFEDRAEVVRRARVRLDAGGPQWVAVCGLSPFVDDRSLQARASCPVLAARVRRRVHHAPGAGRETLAALEAELRAAEERLAVAEQTLERARAEGVRARGVLAEWIGATAQVPPFAADAERLAEWRAAWQAASAAADAAHRAEHEAAAEVIAADEAASRAALRLAEGQTLVSRRETLAEVQLDAPAAGDVDIELTYRTPCALWRPEHVARLDGDALELVTFATAWQRTGERWGDVEARFSTARPGKSASAPLLADDVLTQRKKSDEEKKKVVVEARDQAVAVAGLDRGVRSVDEMPGVDDGGEPLAFSPAGRVSLASDGRPFRVEIARVRVPARVELVAMPERALAAHLRTTATLARAEPALAGPVRLARGAGLVGRGKLPFVAAGEPFELGFGADDAVRVRRAVEESREQTFGGGQRVKRTVKVHLSNLSGDEKRVEVIERVPVSEIEDVEIRLANHAGDGWTLDEKDGFARRPVRLAPGATETVALAYEIKAAARVVLPF